MIGTILLGTLFLMIMIGVVPLIVADDKTYVVTWIIIGTVFNLIFMSFYVYVALPPLTGPLGGWTFLWFPLLINLVAAGGLAMAHSDGNDENDESTAHGGAFMSAGACFVILLLVIAFVYLNSWIGKDQGKLAFANVHQAPVVMMTSGDGAAQEHSAPIPGADEEHLPIVSSDIAVNRAGASLTGTMGSNYSWGQQVIQSVNGHLYRVSLMQFKDIWAWNRNSNKTTLGYIMIDAENPLLENEEPIDYPIRYFTGNYFNNDLLRHLYMNGYSHYLLVDPTVEISDDLKVYETVGLGKYVYGWSGINIEQMAIVDVQTGQIQVCNVSDCPSWLDRVLPDLKVTDTYVDWFGSYMAAGWWNPGSVNTLMSADDHPVAVYNNSAEHNVWQYIMTSTNMKDNSGVGLLQYDAWKREGTYYPFDKPFPIGSQVRSLFENNKTLRQSNNTVDQMILVNIFGENTWVATMVTPGSVGVVYQNTAFVRASKSSASDDVQFDKDPKIALRNYEMWLASHRDVSQMDATQSKQSITLTGTVTGIGTTDVAGNTYHIFTMNDETGQPVTYTDQSGNVQIRYFIGTYDPTQRIELPLVKTGDHVRLTYQDTNLDAAVQIETLDDLDVPPQ